MRKLFLLMNVSVDGYYEDANRDISGFNNDFEAFSNREDGSDRVDTLLFGHNTYEMMKFWRTPQAAEMAPEVAAFMNNTPKVVASHHPFDPEWASVTVIHGDVAEQVRALKAQAGGTIAIFGSNELVVSLMQANLIDEFQIIVNPIAFGAGSSLFRGLPGKTALTLTGSRPFQSGAILLTYNQLIVNS